MEALEKSYPNTAPLGFLDGYLKLGRLRPLARIEDREFDAARIRVLLTAAMGGDRGRRALPYLQKAIEKKRAGEEALAQTCIALSGFDSKSLDQELEWRLDSAERLLNSGVSPFEILNGLEPCNLQDFEKYDPNQPRVPAGNGRESGRWGSVDGSAGSDTTPAVQPDATETSHGSTPADIRVTASSPGWAEYINPVEQADAAEREGKPFNGRGPNDQHQKGVDITTADYQAKGYEIITRQATAVDVPGFTTPRVYDFIVRDPVSANYLGIEVKTTLGDTIFLNASQVSKDVAVMAYGTARARLLNLPIKGVGYAAYCTACPWIDFRSTVLHESLKDLRVPFTHGRFPGDNLP